MKRCLSFLVICTLEMALETIKPGAQWSLRGSDYSGLEWLDSSKKPTLAEVNQGISDCQADEASKKAQKDKAILDAKDKNKTTEQRLDALLKAIDLK